MVPRAGLEPAHPKARDFKSLVSTNFTIGASTQCSDLLHVLSGLSIIRPRLHIFLTQVLWLLVSYTEINFVKNDWLACREGFEPPTLCLEGTCSIHLSYRQTKVLSVILLVPGAGLEPAHPKARDFKSLVSTNFTIRAL